MDFRERRKDTDEAVLAGSYLISIIVAMVPDRIETPFVIGTNGIAAQDLREELPVRPSPDLLACGICNHKIVGFAGPETKRQKFVGGIRRYHHKVVPIGRGSGAHIDEGIPGSNGRGRG